MSLSALAFREGSAGEATAVQRLREDRVGLTHLRFHNYVVRLGRRDLELLDGHRLDVLTIRLHDGHGEARDLQIEVGHRRRIDDA